TETDSRNDPSVTRQQELDDVLVLAERSCNVIFGRKYGNSSVPHYLCGADNSNRIGCHFGRISMARTISKKTPTPSVFELACEAQELEAKQLEALERLRTLDSSGLRGR